MENGQRRQWVETVKQADLIGKRFFLTNIIVVLIEAAVLIMSLYMLIDIIW